MSGCISRLENLNKILFSRAIIEGKKTLPPSLDILDFLFGVHEFHG